MRRVILDLDGSKATAPLSVALKYLLKRLLRLFNIRCRGIRVEESPQSVSDVPGHTGDP